MLLDIMTIGEALVEVMRTESINRAFSHTWDCR